MKRIPIYDATAAVTCTIGTEEVADRLALVERLRRAVARVERTEHGMLLHFSNRPAVEADVRRFAVDEKRCCQFWGFAVGVVADELTLQWDAPPDAGELIERLYAYFTGDGSLMAVTALL